MKIEWKDAGVNENGVKKVAAAYQQGFSGTKYVGYDAILKGDKVRYDNIEQIVVLVSRTGQLKLSPSGTLPYRTSVLPRYVELIEKGPLHQHVAEDEIAKLIKEDGKKI